MKSMTEANKRVWDGLAETHHTDPDLKLPGDAYEWHWTWYVTKDSP